MTKSLPRKMGGNNPNRLAPIAFPSLAAPKRVPDEPRAYLSRDVTSVLSLGVSRVNSSVRRAFGVHLVGFGVLGERSGVLPISNAW
jgi:hypothetical protein